MLMSCLDVIKHLQWRSLVCRSTMERGKKKLGKQHKWCGYLLVSKEFSIVLFL